tara:strand:- start:1489 stop:1686 length:198 start_codon:yes stop_codon:yes gene_type:complete
MLIDVNRFVTGLDEQINKRLSQCVVLVKQGQKNKAVKLRLQIKTLVAVRASLEKNCWGNTTSRKP